VNVWLVTIGGIAAVTGFTAAAIGWRARRAVDRTLAEAIERERRRAAARWN